MAASNKRLDLRFGAFACSVQGFDDPVEPVQQFLRALQHLLEETPELADAGISFDAEAIEQLTGEVARRAELAEGDIEIVPGLVIIRHGESPATAAMAGDEGAAGEEEWARPFAEGDADAGGGAESETSEPAEAEAAFVNIFSPAAGAADFEDPAAALDAAEAEDDEADISAVLAARLGQFGESEPAEAREGLRAAAGGGGVFFDPMAEVDGGTGDGAGEGAEDDAEDDAEEGGPLNLFAAPTGGEAQADEAPGKYGNIFASFEPRSRIDGEAEPDENEESRVSELFGDRDEQPDQENGGGYTAAGLAEAAGAIAVPDLMVSAAAFMVLIQGQTTFTRRDVMDVFETLPGEHEKTLEARIKGFGKAVRNGQLVAVEDGVFGLAQSEVSRFESLL